MPIDPTRRKTKYWYGRGTHLGVSIDRSTGIVIDPRAEARSRETARAVCRSWEREIEDRVIHGKKSVPTFSELAIIYLERGGDPSHLSPLIDHLGEIPGDQIDQARCDKAATAILRPGFAPATVNRHIYTPVRAVLRSGDLEPKIKARKVPRAEKKWFTPEQIDLVLKAGRGGPGVSPKIAARSAAVISMLVGTGMRPGELAAMSAANLYLSTSEARIVPRSGGDKTALSSRMLHLPERSTEALSKYHQLRRTVGGPVIDNGKGEQVPPREAYTRIGPTAFRRAGLEGYTLYDLRHTWATWYYATTRDVRRLMDRGGWSNAEMAMHYTKVAPSDLGDRVRAHGWDMESGEYPGMLAKRKEIYK